MRKSTKNNSPKISSIPQQEGWNYEDTVTKVQDIIDEIESGDLDLAAVFEQFAIATEYLQECDVFLADKQKEMHNLIETIWSDKG
jgi:exodeoxyribonuclease VII small subunit